MAPKVGGFKLLDDLYLSDSNKKLERLNKTMTDTGTAILQNIISAAPD